MTVPRDKQALYEAALKCLEDQPTPGPELEHDLWLCLLCDPRVQIDGNEAYWQHLVDKHPELLTPDGKKYRAPVKRSSVSHADAVDWFQWVYRYTLDDGRDLATSSHRQRRSPADRAYWGD